VRSEVREWYARRTTRAADWSVPMLREHKSGRSVSVVLPALDEEPTVGLIVDGLVSLAHSTGLVDEIVVMDSGSQDATAAVAAGAGARVFHRDEVLPTAGSRPGKGEVLWKALQVTSGDLVVYVDADLTSFGPHYVTGLLGPLLCQPDVALVKGFYDRPLLDIAATGGGRVTELMARPLLGALAPQLTGVVQPLAGEYAARRTLLERLPYVSGYGVEIGLLLDTVAWCGLDAVAQVDLGHRVHGHQDTDALGRMAATILHTVLSRALPGSDVGAELTQFHRAGDRFVPETTDVGVAQRPPMLTVSEYAERGRR
jgi:glucosyl-3-phosphoglycerate synthase